MNKQVQK